MLIPFQIHAALAHPEGSDKDQHVICTIPDLISIFGQDGEAIGTQDLRYGLRVNAIGLLTSLVARLALISGVSTGRQAI
jgi:DUF917 family protein